MDNTKVHDILKTKVAAINSELNNINAGGCGLFALEMHKALKEKGVKSSVVLVNRSGYDKQEVDSLIKSAQQKGINSSYQHLIKRKKRDGVRLPNMQNRHICVKVGNKLYDNNGIYKGEAISKHITIKTMNLFLKAPCWNSTFKWNNESNNDIEGTIAKFFSRLFSKELLN